MATKFEQGKKGEEKAAEVLEKDGYRIIERNYRTRYGEIDIIAQEKDVLCFIEVKTRRSDECGDPLEAVTARKRKTIVNISKMYLQQKNIHDMQVRFDVVAVYDNHSSETAIIRDAFGENY